MNTGGLDKSTQLNTTRVLGCLINAASAYFTNVNDITLYASGAMDNVGRSAAEASCWWWHSLRSAIVLLLSLQRCVLHPHQMHFKRPIFLLDRRLGRRSGVGKLEATVDGVVERDIETP